jgi:hypothetical protein
MARALADGVYIGLREDRYFEQDRLGSTDLVTLARAPADWWYSQKKLNPDWQEQENTTERDFGRALHVLVLEGEAAYGQAVEVRPDEYLDDKTGEVKPWNANATPCRRFLAAAKANGRLVITSDMHRRVLYMAALILNHPDYADALRQGIPEVSVLYTIDGQPMRARFDYLLPMWIIDLKTYGAQLRGKDHRDKAMRAIADRNYDVQRFLYDWARECLVGLVNEGKVHGATAEQHDWLKRVATEPTWSWLWIFYQRRDDRVGHAPIVMPIERPRYDVTFDSGRRKVEVGLAHYRRMRAIHGDQPWAIIEPIWRPLDHEFPFWMADVPDMPDDLPANDNADAERIAS